MKLVCGEEGRSQGDIATAAMASINQFLSKQVTCSSVNDVYDVDYGRRVKVRALNSANKFV